jgi:hypothetical protein
MTKGSLMSWTRRVTRRQWWIAGGLFLLIFLSVAWVYSENDLHKDHLDPKVPFQVYMYKLPPAPDYTQAGSWFLNPQLNGYFADPRKVDVFFIHATSFDGGSQWLGPIDSNAAAQVVQNVQLPNYAGPFSFTGNVYAPRYRQGSLFTQMTLSEDAKEARAFPYRDIEAAFRQFLKTRRGGRGFVIVGVEQGGLLAERLLTDVVAPDPALRSQLVAAYLLETLAPASAFSGAIPACAARTQTGCVVAYMAVENGRPDKALQVLQKAVTWDENGNLTALDAQRALCVNPVIGAAGEEQVDARRSLGATNATGLEWGTDPATIAHRVSSHCLGGLLFVDKPKSPSFRDTGSWEERHKVAPYNLFYGDLQADLAARWQAFRVSNGIDVPRP